MNNYFNIFINFYLFLFCISNKKAILNIMEAKEIFYYFLFSILTLTICAPPPLPEIIHKREEEKFKILTKDNNSPLSV